MTPDDLILRAYQEGMRGWAHTHPKCGLLADMGLGKTPTTLQVIEDSLHDYVDTERWLVVGPKLVALDTWPRALRGWRQFAHLTFRNLGPEDFGLKAAVEEIEMPDGSVTRRKTGLTFGSREDKAAVKRALREFREHIHIVSWDFLPWLVRAYGRNWPYDGIVLDESLFAQSSTSERHKAVYQVVHRLKKVHRLIELTGLPSPNGYEQLHGQMRLLDGGTRLGKSKTDFMDTFMVPAKTGFAAGGVQRVFKWKLAAGAKDEIDRLVGQLCVSLATEDYLQLPPQIVNPIRIALPPAARETYDAIERDLITQLGDGTEILAPSQGVLVSKLLQISNGAIYDKGKRAHQVHTVKLDKLAELLESISGPILMAYSFQHDWERIKARFKHAVHVNESGSLDRFRRGDVKLLCLHPESGAEGLDGLQQVSSDAIWFGATYNARYWKQFNKRLHRDGSTADRVVIHQLLAEDTIEEYVAGRALPDKIEEQESLLEAIKWRGQSVSAGQFCSPVVV